MRKQTIEENTGSRIVWNSLEEWARSLIQGALQDVLEEEFSEWLGRLKSERRKPEDEEGGAPDFRIEFIFPNSDGTICATHSGAN